MSNLVDDVTRQGIAALAKALDASRRDDLRERDQWLSRGHNLIGQCADLVEANRVQAAAREVRAITGERPAVAVLFDREGGATMAGDAHRGQLITWLRELARRVENGTTPVPTAGRSRRGRGNG